MQSAQYGRGGGQKFDDFDYPIFESPAPQELTTGQPVRHKVVVVGGGMVGLTAALDLAQRGIPCVVLDDNNTVATGSRSIGHAKRTMEVWNRLGCAGAIAEKAGGWSTGRILDGEQELLTFQMHPEGRNEFPGFTSLPQFYAEADLKRLGDLTGKIDYRWLNRVVDVEQTDDCVRLHVETPEGRYVTEADWVIAADGVRSAVRESLGLSFEGNSFEQRFIIVDVKMAADYPKERMFWFNPQFYPTPLVLRVPQHGSVWRLDWCLAPHEDAEEEKKPERIKRRLNAMFGDDVHCEVLWVSVYNFDIRRIEQMRHGRVFFAGDAAHQLSPFGGGRGGNSGVQDVDNLVWKLELVLKGVAPESLLDSYHVERSPVADENLLYSLRSTEFLNPSNATSRAFRNAVLKLAPRVAFAKALVNTGRHSVAPDLASSPMVVADFDVFEGGARPGAAGPDAPVRHAGVDGWLNPHINGVFTVLFQPHADVAETAAFLAAVDGLGKELGITVRAVAVLPRADAALADHEGLTVIEDIEGVVAERYALQPGTWYLLRPDQHIAGRSRSLNAETLRMVLRASAGCDNGGRA